MNSTLLEVKNLKKYFKTSKGMLHAVDDISFSIEEGKTLGIVGESGCGKSTTGRTILRLQEPTDGEILYRGENIAHYDDQRMRELRKDVQMIFQDPFSSLNPRKTVSELIGESFRLHKVYKDKDQRYEKVLEIMEVVGLAKRLSSAYPHELDGGRRQRIGIARAISLNPSFIVCDEPVSALDVSIQAQILNLLKDLQAERNLTYIFITHDLSVVNYFSDDIMVMYLGQAVEKAETEELFSHPAHPYTQALLSAIPIANIHDRPERILLKGEITSPIEPPAGCRFAKRCNYAADKCFRTTPQLQCIAENHYVACHMCGLT